jgi:hypothetical protein
MNPVQEAKAGGNLIGIGLWDLAKLRANMALEDPRAGPEKLLGTPPACKCGFPDAGDPEIAEGDVDVIQRCLDCDEEHAIALKKAHASRLARKGSGSWGHCVTGYPDYHSTTYGVDILSFPTRYFRELTDKEKRSLSWLDSPWWGWSVPEVMDRFSGKTVLDACLMIGIEETYRRVGCAHVRVDSKKEASIWIKARPMPGSQTGIGWFPEPGCRSKVEFHIDSLWNPRDLHSLICLFGHECGHCNGLEHTFAGQARHHGVMGYDDKTPYEGFSTGQGAHTLPRDPSRDVLERFYTPSTVPPLNGPEPPLTQLTRRPSEEEFDALQNRIGLELADFRGQYYGTESGPIIW